MLVTTAIATINDNQYSYNTANQIAQISDLGGAHDYGYDSVDRLSSATYPGATAETYSYDGVGNRTALHRSASYTHQPFNKLTSTATATYTYDNNGNLLSKVDTSGTTQFAWDYENRLTRVTKPGGATIDYKYDALGRRIQRTPSAGVSSNFVYDGQDVIRDLNSDGSSVDYLNGLGIDNKLRQSTTPAPLPGPGGIGLIIGAATALYYQQDHLGSTTALTDALGNVVERESYDAFGNTAGSTHTRYGYTGRELDPDTGLMYYRARWYDPQLGRFISEDPIGFQGGDINLYGYVHNDPLRMIDPSGLRRCHPLLGALVGGLLGAGVGAGRRSRPWRSCGRNHRRGGWQFCHPRVWNHRWRVGGRWCRGERWRILWQRYCSRHRYRCWD